MVAFLSPPHTDGSYLEANRFPTPMARISMSVVNATTPSTALAMLYKHALLIGHGSQTLDPDREPRRIQILHLEKDRASHTCHHHALTPSQNLHQDPPRCPSTAATRDLTFDLRR
jgi:hypothetical protein